MKDRKEEYVYKPVSKTTAVSDDLQSIAWRPRLRAYENSAQVKRASEQTICTAYTLNKYPYLGNRLKYISLFARVQRFQCFLSKPNLFFSTNTVYVLIIFTSDTETSVLS